MRPVARVLSTTIVLLVAFGCLSPAEEKLKVGDKAPEFSLPAASKDSIMRTEISLSSLIGKNAIIVAFYPADWSGGCTKEMCTMRDNFADLGSLGATVLGISGDYVFSHREWAKALGLPFLLLSDHKHQVARDYGSYNDVTGFNIRKVFVIDRTGAIAYIDPAYIAGSPASFDKLKTALSTIH